MKSGVINEKIEDGPSVDGYGLFVISGVVISKKNNWKSGKKHTYLGAKYRAWENTAIQLMRIQWGGSSPLTEKINARMLFYLPDKKIRDISNLYQGPEDALQKAGILENDFQIASHDGSGRYLDKENPRVEIFLTELALENGRF